MGIFALVLSCIAAGTVVAITVALTLKWIIRRTKEKMAQGKVNKSLIADIRALELECDNKMSLEKLTELATRGCSHIIADVGQDGSLVEITGIRDRNQSLDEEVAKLLGSKGMVVLED